MLVQTERKTLLESSATADIFELLGVKERENTYTRLLAYLLKASPGLRDRLIERAFGSSVLPATAFSTECQTSLDPENIPDLLLEATDEAGKRWVLFVETKVHASEDLEQTARYHAACVTRVGSDERVGGVFLTLKGADPKHGKVHALSHKELATWVEDHAADFAVNPMLHGAASAYVARARVEPPVARETTQLKALLERREGLIPRLAGAEAIAAACVTKLPGWESWAVKIQGHGHANPGLLFRQAGWLGPEKLGTRWTRGNYNLHLEIELTSAATWRIKLHLETEPYLPQRKLAAIAGHEKFTAMRDHFRKLLTDKLEPASGWKPRGRKLQIATYKLSVGPESTVAELLAALAPALEYIAPLVSTALAKVSAS